MCLKKPYQDMHVQMVYSHRMPAPLFYFSFTLYHLQLLVAEKTGRVRLYDLSTEVSIMSLDAGAAPLMSVDWSPSNSLYVGGVASGSWCVWDISHSRCVLKTYHSVRRASS